MRLRSTSVIAFSCVALASLTSAALADCASDVCPQYQAPSALERLYTTGNCTSVACLRLYNSFWGSINGSADPIEFWHDELRDNYLESHGFPTMRSEDQRIEDDLRQQNIFGGQSPYQPYDAGGVGSVVNGDALNEGPWDPSYRPPLPDYGGVGNAFSGNSATFQGGATSGGTIYNAPPGGSVGVDTGMGTIYNNP